MNMTILGSSLMLSKIKTPAELREELTTKYEKEVNYLLVIIRSKFTGVPCSIKLEIPTEMGSVSLLHPEPDVWKLVQTKLEEELKASGWEPFHTYLTTSGFLFWKTPVVRIGSGFQCSNNNWLMKK